jgi:DNA primase
MPGVDLKAVKSEISMAQVLGLIDFVPTRKAGHRLRGPCPLHGSTSARSCSFSVDLDEKVYYCFKCGAGGSHLDLWMELHGSTVFEAALDLCERLGVEIPRIHRW